MSFAPLAGRLAAHVVSIRPAEDARNDMAKVMALVMCVILEMFILLCEALDARALADANFVAAAPRDARAACVPALRTERPAVSGARRARLPRLAPELRAEAPISAAAPFAPTRSGPWLAWSRDAGLLRANPGLPDVAPSRKTVFPSAPTHALFVTIS